MNKISKNEETTITVDIPFDLKDKLKFEAYKTSKKIKEIVKEALEKYFIEKEKEKEEVK